MIEEQVNKMVEDFNKIEIKELNFITSALTELTTRYENIPKEREKRITFLDIIDKGYNENYISDYLAFLLNPKINGIGNRVLHLIFQNADKPIFLA